MRPRWRSVALALLTLTALLALPFAAPLGVGAGGFRGVAELAYGKDGDLWLARADGSERRALTARRDPQVVAVPESWSPDGRWLAYTLQPVLAYPGDQRLLLLDTLTGAERTVVARTFEPQLAWSADSRRLLVEGVVDPSSSPGGPPLHVYDLARSQLSPIDVPHAGAPRLSSCARITHVSPGAEWLAYPSLDGDLRLRHLPSGRERSLGLPPDESELCVSVAWSPDARWFAWTRAREDLRGVVDPGPWANPPRDVYAMRVDAAGMADAVALGTVSRGMKCCHWASHYRPLLWSPDGRWLDSWFFMPELFARSEADASGAAPPAGGWPGLHDCAPGDAACRARTQNPYH